MKKFDDSDRLARINAKLKRLRSVAIRDEKNAELVGQYIDYINSGDVDPESAVAQWKQIELLLQASDLELMSQLSEELAFSDALFELGRISKKDRESE